MKSRAKHGMWTVAVIVIAWRMCQRALQSPDVVPD